ncbi:MAG TPA: type II toxin-antitoxin system VapC family toxin [Iamia sp.]|nr:type II toxin-antitoxin system VapC family toxin [Iamia sp.]
MGVSPGAVADTSYYIAHESGRPVRGDDVPPEVAVSVVTIAELRVGVHAAADERTRALRQETLDAARGATILDIDSDVAEVWAEMRVHLAASGRRVHVNDLWIAATAAVHHLPVVTQDDDFDPVLGVRGLEIVKV